MSEAEKLVLDVAALVDRMRSEPDYYAVAFAHLRSWSDLDEMHAEMAFVLEALSSEVDRLTAVKAEMYAAAMHAMEQCKHLRALVAKKNAALEAIITRSDNGELGTSKVIDMRNIAFSALPDED